jgi:hypothetical protein
MADAPELVLSYTGIAFRQNDKAPELFAFVASANELKRICGVARKSEQMLTNYQRALDEERVNREVWPFFKMPQNCSPTAIVLSLHSTPVAKVSFDDVADPGGAPVNLKRLKITARDVDKISDDEVIASAIQLLDERLKGDAGAQQTSGAEASSETSSQMDGDHGEEDEAGEEEGDDEAEESNSQEDSEEEDEDDDETDEVEIGKSMLTDLRAKLVNKEDITQDLLAALRDMLRPALVIDGQHRLFGAAKVEEGIPLLVCSLVNPEWKEQVFQFTVINDKARGIPKPFITSLAGMSLTAGELNDLQKRLAQAGVHLWEVDVMQHLGYDSRSPFFQRVEFKVGGKKGTRGLGYQTMKQVGKAWFDPNTHGLHALMRILFANGKKKSTKVLKAEWQRNDVWFDYFCCFWHSFYKKFGATDLWKMHSSLMTAIVLKQLQETFLTYLDSVSALTIETIQEPDDSARRKLVFAQFEKIVEQFSQKFEAKHFPQAWGIKSLNHKDGKAKLQDYFEKVRQGKFVGNHPLRTGNIA